MKLLSLEKSEKMEVGLARRVSMINLLCWPVAAILYYAGLDFLGYIAGMVAFLTLLLLMRTGMFRIVGGRVMDDVELDLQRRAHSYAYGAVSAVLMLGLLFAYIGHDTIRINAPSLFRFETGEVLSFMVWMAIDVLIILPAAFLAWILPTDEIEED